MKRKNLIKTFLVSLVFASAGFFGVILNDNNVSTVKAAELFQNANGVTIVSDYAVDASLGLNDQRKGIYFSSEESGSKVNVAKEMVGGFEIDFRVFTPTTFDQLLLHGDTLKNPALVLQTLTFRFDNTENDDFFELVIDGGSKMNFAVPQAFVRVNGEEVGIFYFEFNDGVYSSSGNTSSANNTGRYTALYGTTFSNKAYKAFETETEAASTVLCFDPATMRVYAKQANGSSILIWDLSSPVNDGQTASVLDSFEKYSVSFEFTRIALGKKAEMVMYSLNGQSLAGQTLTNSIGPSVYAKDDKNGLKGEKFYLSSPICEDLLNPDARDVNVSVTLNNTKIPVYNGSGNIIEKFENGCYVLPMKSGSLQITYTAFDGEFEGVPHVIYATVYDFEPKPVYSVGGFIEDAVYGVGSVLTLPKVAIESPLFKKTVKDAVVSVYKDGSCLEGYDKIAAGCAFTFAETGEYVIEYTDSELSSVLKYDITVTETKPAFNYESELAFEFSVGQLYTFPKVKAIFGGETKDAKIMLYYPDGSVYANPFVQFEKAGVYRLVYSATFNGAEYRDEKVLTVSGELPSFTPSIRNGGTVEYGVANPRYKALNGCLITSYDDTTVFTYNKIIDLSASTKDDLLIKLYSAVDDWSTRTFPTIILRDVYDPSNFLTISLIYGWQITVQAVRAYAPGQTSKGFRNSTLLINDQGTNVYFPGYGQISPERKFLDQSFDLYYDAAEKAIYTRMANSKKLIIDFDSSEYQEVIWGGFTTGEVYLSVSGFKNLMVSEIYGNDFTEEFFEDKTAPVLFTDTGSYGVGDLPKAIINKPYKIYDYICTDNYDVDPKVDVKVFYGQYKTFDVMIENGCFTPKYEGVYTIRYEARDAFGNISVKTLQIETINVAEVVPVDYDLEFGLADTITIGNAYKIPKVVSKHGGISDLSVNVSVVDPTGEAVQIKGNKFIPDKVGKYVLTYSVADYVGNGTPNEKKQVVEINVTMSDLPILNDVLFPEAILSGLDYELPIVKAYDYNADISTEINVSVEVRLNGTQLEVQNGRVCPTVASGSSGVLKVKYIVENSVGSVEKEYEVKVINPGSGSGYMAGYFYSSKGNVVSTATKDGVLLNATQSGSVVQFINPLLANTVVLNFSVFDSRTDADSFTVHLYDYRDRNVSVSMKVLRNNESETTSYFLVNGGIPVKIAGSFSSNEYPFSINYLQDFLALMDAQGQMLGSLVADENGNVFKGFPSRKVWVEIEFGEIGSDGFALQCITLNNQNLNYSDEDVVRPQAVLDGYIPEYIEKDTVLTIPKIISQDVLSGKTTVRVQLICGRDVVFTAENNEPFDYKFTEPKYTVKYTISDGSGWTVTPTYTINIIEYVPPEIVFDSEFKTTAEVGTEYTLPKYTVTDNTGVTPKVVITVVVPTCSVIVVKDGIVRFDTVGKYIIRYLVYDSYYNSVMLEFVVNVK